MFDAQDLQQAGAPVDTGSGHASAQSGRSVHLLDKLTAIFRHRRIAGTAFVIVVGLMMLQTYSKIPLYRTSARVVIQDERTTAVGNLNATLLMGPQLPKALVDLLQECADADGGILYEPRDTFGLAYRTRESMYSQAPVLTSTTRPRSCPGSSRPMTTSSSATTSPSSVRAAPRFASPPSPARCRSWTHPTGLAATTRRSPWGSAPLLPSG